MRYPSLNILIFVAHAIAFWGSSSSCYSQSLSQSVSYWSLLLSASSQTSSLYVPFPRFASRIRTTAFPVTVKATSEGSQTLPIILLLLLRIAPAAGNDGGVDVGGLVNETW